MEPHSRYLPKAMMIIRMYGLVVAIALQGLVFSTGNVYAAGVKQQTIAVKQQNGQQKAKSKKIHHPCARKSAAQLNQRAKPYLNSMTIHAIRYEVDRDLIQSVITVESCYRLKALSPKNAQGLMQLIPATAERFGIRNPYNAYQNIKGGTRYLAWLSKRFNGDLSKVLAAYNAGEGKVDRYNGIPPYRETRNYVHDVLAVYNKLKQHKQQSPQPAAQKQIAVGKRVLPTPAVPAKPAQAVVIRPPANLTPQQRQLWLKRQQLRQIQLRKQQQRQAQLRRQQLLAQRRQQQARHSNSVIVTGKPSQPIYAPVAPQPQPVPRQPEITIGQPPIRTVDAKQPVRQARQQPVRPVLRKARAVAGQPQPANFLQQQVNKTQGGRVRSTYRAPVSKPGRGGWEATKRLAPQLFKQ